ncbi:MAG: 16S rRNA (cytosine(1402)-N(4))-methyltransferase RsmH [Rhizobiales bacterium]|nr:16S rRNA (cytosine(1402)-N(4))-methyltransferase RsmH [Hyphomicrobiales bacterium]
MSSPQETTTPAPSDGASRHIPVLLQEVLQALAPASGEVIVDGTFGAGGYSRAILATATCEVIAIDRDPNAIAAGQAMVAGSGGRLRLLKGTFGEMESLVQRMVDGVVLDIGVSSMQLDEAERGFSFLRDGPLDMRMSAEGISAADVVNTASAERLADIIFVLGEEHRSRHIARAIVKAREEAPLRTTFDLVRAVENATGPQRAKDRTHPATRTFQALRIFVNGELDELGSALFAAERMLKPGGRLVVVTFHSLEDRVVKRFFAQRSGNVPISSRHAPGLDIRPDPSFTLPFKGHVEAAEEELARNPRARSAKLRAGLRTAAAAHPADLAQIGVPELKAVRH